jgi:hypothetical protein
MQQSKLRIWQNILYSNSKNSPVRDFSVTIFSKIALEVKFSWL